MPLSIRENPMHLSQFSAFCGIRSRIHDDQKDVYLLEWLGLPASPEAFALQLAAAREQAESRGHGFVCLSAFETHPGPSDAARMSALADTLLAGERLSLPGLTDPQADGLAEAALRGVLDLYRSEHPSASDSMVKNCTVRLLCALSALLPRLFPSGSLSDQPKCILIGRPDPTARLLLLTLPGLGCDTALIQPAGGATPLLGPRAVLLHGIPQDDFDLHRLPETNRPADKPAPALPRAVSQPPQTASRPAVSIPPRPMRPAPSAVPDSRVPAGQPPDYEALAALAASVVMIDVLDQTGTPCSSGSGVLIAPSGIILTNFHVASRGACYAIHLENQETVFQTDELLKYHADDDLALLRLPGCPAQPIPLYTGPDLRRGQPVVAIGSPLGLFNSVSDGMISGFRSLGGTDMIQFTAPTSPGSSGGALLDRFGRLIGIVTAGFEGGQNLNLAVSYSVIGQFVRGFI